MREHTANNEYTLRDVTIVRRNFSGVDDGFNSNGYRHFSIRVTDPDVMDAFAKLGFKITVAAPDDEGNPAWLVHNFNLGKFYKVVKICDGRARRLDNDTLGELDHCRIKKADLSFTTYKANKKAAKWTHAFVKELYVTVEETVSELAREYSWLTFTDDRPEPIDLANDDLTF